MIPRRTFVMSTLISGFTTAVARGASAPIVTDAAGLTAGEVKIPVADGTLPAYAVKPDHGGPFATILVIEEIFGVHDYIKDVCRRLAKLGYLAVAPEIYARIGDPSKYSSPQEIFTNVILKAPDATMLSDLDSAAAWAAATPGSMPSITRISRRRSPGMALSPARHRPFSRTRRLIAPPACAARCSGCMVERTRASARRT
jgi:hypothetical protein